MSSKTIESLKSQCRGMSPDDIEEIARIGMLVAAARQQNEDAISVTVTTENYNVSVDFVYDPEK